MVRFMLVTVEGGGNVPPERKVMAELLARGHEVHVLADAALAEASASATSFTALEELDFWKPRGQRRRSVLASIRDAARLLSDTAVSDRVSAELARIRPDVVLVDCLLPGCVRASRSGGYRTVVLFHTYLAYWHRNLAPGPAGLLARVKGVSPRAAWKSADLRIVLSDRELDPSPPEAGTVWTGSTEPGVASTPGEPPLVVLSLSTMEAPGQEEAYHRATAALGLLDVRGVVTLGGLRLNRPLDPPPNVEVRGYASHDELFQQASLVITHGGHSTVFRALAHGVPLVVMPLHPLLDQLMIGRSVEAAGAGTTIKLSSSAEAVAEAARRVLGDPGCAAAAAGIGERLRSYDGAHAAADELERVFVRS